MKFKTLIAAAMLAASTLAAHADGAVADGTQILTCSGPMVAATKGYFAVECQPPKGQESYTLDLSDISQAERERIIKVCGFSKDKGEPYGYCRVQAHTKDHPTMDDAQEALEILHVTNKPKFSWEH
ncbi:hypothetical protein [Bradyrhizobium liaoningense]|uniref:hypothetical protein n=1 Tax=Bradyrhizobium liaoningense TaxID=43992 RepID=UPI001BA742AE|nr:hypothetical protein [Bradyrhizobium liaoningense]MBR0941002.1 hypothetical protein [Bradyrhizobium liaoningense]